MPKTSGTDHVAVVTGANHGIGAAVARALSARGVGVLCTYLREAEEEATDDYRRARAAGGEEVAEERSAGQEGGPRRWRRT
ncbi:hypothetical protein O7599_04140 [Streptomyces sp. WMMC500]|uniref:hypothetical protein n=1 Tax=Streptomyces sp. WMMC500 TaxID=3015154 RepID=UPI00248B3AD2|nr:hypothetical protein [Streptomyces sp. WMMC500]WBB64795.1 hypothetical protein O7599_04140 [Streptomyces sp. WMMC500]